MGQVSHLSPDLVQSSEFTHWIVILQIPTEVLLSFKPVTLFFYQVSHEVLFFFFGAQSLSDTHPERYNSAIYGWKL